MGTRTLLRTSALFILLLLVSFGCRKKKDTIAVITVVGNNNAAVSGAEVNVFGSGTLGDLAIDKLTTTNSKGEAKFNFDDVYQLGQAGVAVLDILVLKDGIESEGVIKVEEEVTTEETVFINI